MTGIFNTATGGSALGANTTGSENTATGYQALYSNTTGAGNTATGGSALGANTTGEDNTATGLGALGGNTKGYGNTAIGVNAMSSNTVANSNTAIGQAALLLNTTGTSNTAIGYEAGLNGAQTAPKTGTNSTFVGAYATATVDALTNATAIGFNAQVGESNALVLGAAVNTLVSANTKVGIDVASPSNIFTVLQGGGDAISDGWKTYSSRRWKSDIQPLQGALGKVELLRGVSYTYTANGKHDIGMIAEEVGKVVPEVVSYEENGKDARGIDYARLTALLVEAVKQQQSEIHRLEAKVRRLEASRVGAIQPVTKPARTAAGKAGK